MAAIGPWDWGDWLVVFVGELPMLIDWARGRLGASGSNAVRLLTGGLGGIALGRAFYLYFRETHNELFWTNLALLLICAVSVEAVRALRLRDVL